jgi:hypothetical protein
LQGSFDGNVFKERSQECLQGSLDGNLKDQAYLKCSLKNEV